MDEHWLQGFIHRAEERGVAPSVAQSLLKKAGLGGSLKTLGTLGLGGAGALGGLALKDTIEDVQKSDSQVDLGRMLEQTQSMSEGSRDAYIANYLKDLMKRRHDNAKDIYNL
jgi:hypothetical protein